jgi:glycosyltransferase involved in cell wall biosynthesis
VSVVVPVFNGEPYLRDARASIERQRYPDIEVVVVDDGSTDGTAAIIDEPGFAARAIHQPNAGPAAARNRGIEASTGELVAFLDADDLWPDDKLATQVACLVREPDLDVVLGRIKYVALDGAVVPALAFEDPVEKTLSSVHLGSAVFRRRAFERVGGFDEELRFSEDHDWFLCAREVALNMRILPEVTLVYRLHDQNMTRLRTTHDFGMTQVLKKSLDRRRAMGDSVELGRWLDLGDGANG